VDVSNKLKSFNGVLMESFNEVLKKITINEEKLASIHNQSEEAIAKMEALIKSFC
jgi:hypothetical protein